jgi:hypothetical protein
VSKVPTAIATPYGIVSVAIGAAELGSVDAEYTRDKTGTPIKNGLK